MLFFEFLVQLTNGVRYGNVWCGTDSVEQALLRNSFLGLLTDMFLAGEATLELLPRP